MKKVLFTLVITIAVLFGKTQTPSIWFNELVPQPNGDDEYIEFYNTSTTDISLDCYIVVSYFKAKIHGNDIRDAIYVFNFPSNATIKALSHFTISSDNPVSYKSSGNNNSSAYTPSDPTSFSNWNANGDGGSIDRYIYNGTWGNAESVGNNFTDFMDISNGNDATLFLYKINSDGTTSFVNGFLANQGTNATALLSTLEGFGSLPIRADAGCVSEGIPIQLDFAGLSTKNIDFVTMTQAAGSSNGYAKKGDGYCGSWEKATSGEFTPGAKNIFGNNPSNFTSVENYYCNNIVTFSVQSALQSYFPIQAELYIDNGTIPASYDTGDDFIASLQIESSGQNYYSIPVTGNPQSLILVYRSVLGCFTKVVALTPANPPAISMAGTISCTQNLNNKRTVTYSITAVTSATAFPLTLIVREDNGTSGIESDDREIITHTINSLPFTYTAELSNDYSNVTLSVQSNPLSCASTTLLVPNGCTALPVRLSSFSVARNKHNKEQVVLRWQTSSEQNNRGFHVQRKTSGEWKEVAFVPTQVIGGNSNYLLTYEFTDINSFYNTSQYRLLQMDIDGKATFSDVISVIGTEQNDGILIYPNPGINGKINVVFKEQNAAKQVIVFDINGRIIQQFQKVKDNSLTIQGLPVGFYTIKIIDHSTMKTSVEKVIIK